MTDKKEDVFIAKSIAFIEEDDFYTFGLADDDEHAENYIFILYSKKNIEMKDVNSDQNQEYFQSSFIDGGDYGVVRNITICDNKIIFYIEPFDYAKTITVYTYDCTQSPDEIYGYLLNVHNSVHSTIHLIRKSRSVC